MKIQDLIFGIVFLLITWKRNTKLAVLAGLSCLLLAMPLFKFWVFFTAERLVRYAAGFFLITIILFLIPERWK